MPAQTLDLRVDQDTDYSQDFSASDPETRVPTDFTGAAARLMLRVTPGDAAPLVSVSTTPNASGSIALSLGLVTITIAKAATATLTVPRCLYELMIDWADGTTTALMAGNVFVNPAVTH